MKEIPNADFIMSEIEITQKLYTEIMKFNPSEFSTNDLAPIDNVSWYDALLFCNLLSKKDGLKQVYKIEGKKVSVNKNANGYRLPTREEWEYAAKGGDEFEYSGSNVADEVAWHCFNSNGQTQPVAQLKPNSYELYDMSGNVQEWCYGAMNDDFKASYQQVMREEY